MNSPIIDPACTRMFQEASEAPEAVRTQLGRNAAAVALHRDLLALRRGDAAFRSQLRRGVDGAVLGKSAFALRFFAPDRADRLLLVNLGHTLHLEPTPEPLLAGPTRAGWRIHWSSEDPRYGGAGTPDILTDEGWRVPAEAAVVLEPVP